MRVLHFRPQSAVLRRAFRAFASLALLALIGIFALADDPLVAPGGSLAYEAPNIAGSATDWHDLGTEATANAWNVAGRITSGKLRVDATQGFLTFEYTGIKWGSTNGSWLSPLSQVAAREATTSRGNGVVETVTVQDAGFEDVVNIPASGGTGKLQLFGKITTQLGIERDFGGDSTATVFTTDGPINFVDAQGNRVLGSGLTRVFDSSGRTHDCDITWTQVADGFAFSVAVPSTWLNASTYPISIHPIFGKPEAISTESVRADLESQCAYGGGQYLAVWTSKATAALAVSALTTAGEDIYARLVAPDGSFTGPSFAVATGSAVQKNPHVAFASGSGGVFAVVHKDGNNVVLKRYSTTGGLLSTSTVNDPSLSNRVTTVDVASNGTDRFCITWIGYKPGETARRVWAELRGADGSVVAGDTVVGSAPGTVFNARPSVLWNSTLSQWFFTWESYDDAVTTPPKQVIGRSFDATLASAPFAEVVVSAGAGSNYDARIAWSATANEYLVAWDNNPPTGTTNVHARRVNAVDGTLLGTEFNVETSTRSSTDVGVAWIPNSNRWVAVFELSGGGRGVFGQAMLANGTLTGPLFVLSDGLDFGEMEPALTRNGDLDQYLSTWTDGSATTQDIWGARLDLTPPAVPGPVTTSNDASSITLTWPMGAETDIRTYVVYRATTPGGPYGTGVLVLPTTDPTVSYTDTTVSANTRYYYIVRAVDVHANTVDTSAEASEIIDTIPPAAPVGLAATPASESVDLTWTPNAESDLAGYNAYFRVSGTTDWTKANAALIGAAAFTVSGLVNGTTYELAVAAVDTEPNQSPLSDIVSATPAGTLLPPAAPVGMLAVAGPGQVTLTWTPNSELNIAGYDVYYRSAGESDWIKVNSVPVAGTTFTVSGLVTFSLYDFALRAVNSAALVSPFSETIVARAGAVPSASPPGVTATAGNRAVSLTWTASSGFAIAGYDVFRSSSATGTFHRLNALPLSALSYSDTGLTNGTTYHYRVAAVQGAPFVNGNFSAAVSATPQFPAPGGLVLDSSTGTSATMSWGAVSQPDLAGYRVYRSSTAGGGYAPASPPLLSATSFTDSGLTAGTWYWVVTAVATGGDESPWSNEITVTLSGIPTPAPPSLDASNVRKTNDDHPLITGSALAGYVVKIYDGSTLLATVTSDGTTGRFSVHTTVALSDGEYVIQATQQASESEAASSPSSGRVVTVDTTPPATPADVSILGGDGWVLIEWKENTEPDLLGYNVYRKLEGPEALWIKLNTKPLLEARYVDRDVANGTTYKYRVTAADDTVREK